MVLKILSHPDILILKNWICLTAFSSGSHDGHPTSYIALWLFTNGSFLFGREEGSPGKLRRLRKLL